MPDPRIGIEIELLGKNVLNELRQIQDVLNNINRKTFRVTVSDAGGIGKILTKLDEVVEAIKFVNNTTVRPKVDDSPFVKMKSSVSDVRKEVSALNSEMRNVQSTMRSVAGLLTGTDIWYMGPNGQGMRFSEMAFMNTPNLRHYMETVTEAYSIMSRYRNMPNYPRLGYTAPYGYLGASYNYSSLYPVPSGFNYPWEYTIFSTQAPNWTWGRGKEFGGYLTGAVREVGKSFDDANESANNLYRTLSNRAYSVSESARNFSDLAGSLSSFSYNAANLFDMISSFGFGSQVNTVISTLTSQFTGSITGGISNAYERYDVFVRYPRIMESFGISIEDASVALDRLNTAVLGLPTSLNDIAQSSTEFVAILSGYGYEGADLLNRSADLAIAVNNAVLASGASEADASYAMQQLQNFIATGQLTSNQWRSLRRTIPVALSEIAKDMGFNSYVEMRNAIVSGDKSMDDFIDSLIRLGTNDGPIAQLADISKLTLNAISANIKNAFSRLIAGRINEEGEIEGGLLGSLNQIIRDRYGEALPEYIKNRIIPRIDAFSSVLSNAILTHEDEIFAFVDKVLAYDWEGLIGKIAKLLSYRWDILLSLFEKIPQGLLAFATVGASDIAKILRLLGVFSTMASIISRFNAGVMSKAASRLFSTGVPGMILPKGSSFAGSASATGSVAGSAITSGLGSVMGGTALALGAIGAAGYALYKQWNAANEEAETYYLTIDKLRREGELTKENLETLRKQIESKISTVQEAYDAYLEDYRKRYELYVNGGGEKSFEEWLPWWARWKKEDYEKAIAEYEQALTRIHNLEIMTSDTWDTFVTEADKIGGIPEDLKTAFEQGTVEIPDTLDEFLALISGWTGEVETEVDEGFKGAMTKGKKQVDQGIQDIKGSMDTFVNDFGIYGERLSSQGGFLGDAFGRSLYNQIAHWINQVFPLLDFSYTQIGTYSGKSSGGKTGTPGEMKKRGFAGVAFGGRIYRQGGTDKDTVLTWLQPGEYVLRKKAADKLGGDILNKLNNFNFKGAIQALSERVGAGMSPYAYAGATGNTRIYNNNAQATINVNNATQEFTQRRASKWVRGLK